MDNMALLFKKERKQAMKKATKTDMKASKTEMQALYTAFDIHRRAAVLAAKWIAFDPFGAVVYELRTMEEAAYGIREAVNTSKEYWNYSKEPNHPLVVKDGKDEYATFANHIKGIERAVRRLLSNKWARNLPVKDNNQWLETNVEALKDSLKELKANF